eukprot:TRINITY_DN4593_c0_g1_i2.p1 TRINITY_DN4593_c0_g1~~TRINITY_DN4593_c0_g1_i2.p1  ORF type:complete len:185 (+),score=16.94 TRINITY_DN4593_c0_g1_i2:98-652(+)
MGLLLLGKCYLDINEWGNALENFQQCEALHIANPNLPFQFVYKKIYDGIIDSYLGLKEFSKAQEYTHKLEKKVKSLKGEKSKAYAYVISKMGDLCTAQEDFDKALQHYERSREILLQTCGEKHSKFAKCLNKIAWTLYRKSDFELSYELNIKAMTIIKNNGGRLPKKDIQKVEELALLLSVIYA